VVVAATAAGDGEALRASASAKMAARKRSVVQKRGGPAAWGVSSSSKGKEKLRVSEG
jgi:hypothetical protein